MNKLITIDDAMSVFDDFTRGDLDTEDVILLRDMLEEKAIPTAEPKWTPCSERMPKPRETENMIAKYYLIQNEYGDMMVARYVGKGWEQMYHHDYIEDKVVAWMPLPKPYDPPERSDKE